MAGVLHSSEIARAVQPEGMLIGPSGTAHRMREGTRAEIDRLVGTKRNDFLAVRDAVKGDGDWNRAKLVQLFGQGRADRVVNAVDREAAFERSTKRWPRRIDWPAQFSSMRLHLLRHIAGKKEIEVAVKVGL